MSLLSSSIVSLSSRISPVIGSSSSSSSSSMGISMTGSSSGLLLMSSVTVTGVSVGSSAGVSGCGSSVAGFFLKRPAHHCLKRIVLSINFGSAMVPKITSVRTRTIVVPMGWIKLLTSSLSHSPCAPPQRKKVSTPVMSWIKPKAKLPQMSQKAEIKSRRQFFMCVICSKLKP